MAKKKTKKNAKKSFVEVFKKFGKFKSLPELDRLPIELRRLNERWDTVPKHIQQVVLMLTRVLPIPSGGAKVLAWHPKRGKDPEWLPMALTILKDSKGYLSDREIARRVGVSHSTLCRNETYRNARKTYLQPFATIGGRGVQEKEGEDSEK